MNETKVEEILNQYQSKHTYIVPTVVAELWTLHRICLPRSYLANHHYIIMIITIAIFKIILIIMIMIAPWKPEVDFAACDSSPILMFYPLVPRTQDLWILSAILHWSYLELQYDQTKVIQDDHLKEPQCDRMIWWSKMKDERATCCVPFHQDTSGTGLPPLASHLF